MLEQLRIRHLAVVEDVSIRFQSRLNLLTGETGAGKSIIVESLSLLLGDRADAGMVRSGRPSAVIEAVFRGGPDGGDGELIARREIAASGRTQARLDGAAVPLHRLRAALDGRLALLGQHSQQGLLRPALYLDLLDRFAGLSERRLPLRQRFRRLRDLDEELRRLEGDPESLRTRRELLEYQTAEIREVDPAPGEDEDLRRERDFLRHTGRYRTCCDSLAAEFDSEEGVQSALHRIETDLRELAAADGRFAPYGEKCREFLYLLQDLERLVAGFRDSIDTRPERLAEVEERLSRIQSLKNRFGGTLEAVLRHRQEWEAELDRLRDTEGAGRRIREEREAVREEYRRGAAELSERRRAAAAAMEEQLGREIRKLAFPRGATVRIDLHAVELEGSPFRVDGVPVAAGPAGWDQVDLRLAANPGEAPRPLARIASGGELSRFLLALQCLGAQRRRPGRTLVFDEIDAGVGGEVAAVVGDRLRRLAASHQVICVTHWAQVAASADSHFRVEKRVEGGRTLVAVRRLAGAERKREIARMLGGRVTPASSLRHAGELLAALAPAKGRGSAAGAEET